MRNPLAATLAAGLLAEAIGLRATSWLAPLGGLLAAVILWASPVRGLLLPERPGDEVVPPGPGAVAAAAAAAAEVERDAPVGG